MGSGERGLVYLLNSNWRPSVCNPCSDDESPFSWKCLCNWALTLGKDLSTHELFNKYAFYLLERQIQRGRDRNRNNSHPLIHWSNASNDWGWTGAKCGLRTLIQVSPMSDKNLIAGSITIASYITHLALSLAHNKCSISRSQLNKVR